MFSAESQLAQLQESVKHLHEQLERLSEDFHETLKDLENRLRAQERWQARLTGIWIACGAILGYLFGRG